VTYSDDIVLSPQPDAPGWIRLLWINPAADVPSTARRIVAAVLVVIASAATAWSGVVHLKLWHEKNGYAQLPTVGKLFLLQGIACLVVAAAALALRRLVVVVVGALLMASSIGGLAISLTGRGLFGYNETRDSPYVIAALVVESVAVASFVAAALVALTAPRPSA
jgi:hypothetical protein